MTIKEIKDLTRFLTDEEIEKIKEEIKSKEDILKKSDIDEEEYGRILNTLFAILVIEKTLESEIEGIEDIRSELEEELIESYQVYEVQMAKYKKEDKKKKKNWLLNFLFLNDRISAQKRGIGVSNKTIAKLQNELNTLRQQKSDENLKSILKEKKGPKFDEFIKQPKECRNPHHHHDSVIDQMRCAQRKEKLIKDIIKGNKKETLPRGKNRSNIKVEEIRIIVKEQGLRKDSESKENVFPEIGSGIENPMRPLKKI